MEHKIIPIKLYFMGIIFPPHTFSLLKVCWVSLLVRTAEVTPKSFWLLPFLNQKLPVIKKSPPISLKS